MQPVNNFGPPRAKLFGRQRPLHAALGGGKVADLLLWRDIKRSAALVAGIGAIWFLFEFSECNLLPLSSGILVTTMLVIFVWSRAAEFFKWKGPPIPKVEATFKEIATILHSTVNAVLSNFLYIASGNDKKLFSLTITLLVVLSIIGCYVSTLNLLFIGLLCLETLPIMYEKFEDEVENVGRELIERAGVLYKKFDTYVLQRIPRGPGKND